MHVLMIVVAIGVIVAMIAMLGGVVIGMVVVVSMVVVVVVVVVVGGHVPMPGRLVGVRMIERKLIGMDVSVT
jgi:hypothetical protein